MTLPLFKKTWQISPNNALAAQADALTTNRVAMLNMINALTGAGSFKLNGDVGAGTFDWYGTDGVAVASPLNFATVRYTCDSTAVSSLGVNLLTDPSDFVWAGAGVAHSHAILDFEDAETEVMISCRNVSTAGSTLTVAVSHYGATGNRFAPGTTTADPVATGSYDILSVGPWGGCASTNAPIKIHVWKSSDGEAFEVIMCNGGEPTTVFRVERPIVYNDLWVNPAVVTWKGGNSGTSQITVALFHSFAAFFTYADGQNTTFSLGMPYTEGSTAVSLALAPNAITGEWDMFPQWLSKKVAPVQGTHGELNDVYWAPLALVTTNISSADLTYPAGRLAVVGDQWRPWVPGFDFEAA